MITLLSAPSNLGLRPSTPGSVPGAGKAPEAFRDAGLHEYFLSRGARDAGVVLAGRYLDDDAIRPTGIVHNEAVMTAHARLLADRLALILDSGGTPLVLGGDCSILIGLGLALAKRGRAGLVHVDGHTDFRRPGTSEDCASVAGEDLAAAIGLHNPSIADIDGAGPYFRASRAVHIGHRNDDEHAADARQHLGLVIPASQAISEGAAATAERARSVAEAGYWLQLDVDVLDPTVMPAVDSPDPGGLDASQLIDLLRRLAPAALGASVTVFDPDLDPTGDHARLLTGILSTGLADLGAGV
ncbi:arginase family protein (plasmid) [Rathayibacter sp. VKM Ac-2803]|uniref:Arginase n=1 Tax=Rathayibacter caricis DSM 15933 TaxID=1328867 RepID=A0A2T4UP21_9MICO|nr:MULTISPECIES: arginase family protein [Rathayibacter]MWV51441.1 arginase family protein [Rathayibacter sp. VKM Ac-2803]PTL71273.1 arginase [Rathayibacter caricis DSM 15933]